MLEGGGGGALPAAQGSNSANGSIHLRRSKWGGGGVMNQESALIERVGGNGCYKLFIFIVHKESSSIHWLLAHRLSRIAYRLPTSR